MYFEMRGGIQKTWTIFELDLNPVKVGPDSELCAAVLSAANSLPSSQLILSKEGSDGEAFGLTSPQAQDLNAMAIYEATSNRH